MTLSITDTLVTSDITHHWAMGSGRETWVVTWWNPKTFGDRDISKSQAAAAIELAEIIAKGRDDKETTNYAYLTWQRVKELAEVLGVVPLKTVLYLESLERGQ